MLWPSRAERIARRADSWAVRSDDPLSPREIAQRDAWRAADPLHEQAWRRTQSLWTTTEGMPRPRTAPVQSPARPRLQPRLALAGLVVVAAAGASVLIEGHGSRSASSTETAWITTDQAKHARLADGTMVDLDPGSAIHADLGGPVRSVALVRGTARFDVAHDSVHPFVVSAADRRVVAIGTRFEVTLRPNGLVVTLFQGAIEVSANSSTSDEPRVQMRHGERLTIDDGRQMLETVPADHRLSSTEPRDVGPTQIGLILAEANETASVPIRLADASLSARRVEGHFDTTDTRALAAQLGTTLDLQVEQSGGAYWLSVR